MIPNEPEAERDGAPPAIGQYFLGRLDETRVPETQKYPWRELERWLWFAIRACKFDGLPVFPTQDKLRSPRASIETVGVDRSSL
jgi:hypothetical protein